MKTAGTQTLTFTDTAVPIQTATVSVAVSPAAAVSVQLAGFPTATTAGVAQAFTVTLRDAFGNVASGYTGTVAFSSSDLIAALPANYTFTAADAGVRTFTAALKRAGTQSLTVADTAAPTITSAEGGIVVSAAAVSQFAISGPSSVTQSVGFKITVSAEDAFGNVNAGYRGTVHLSSTDATGGTQNFTFSNNDNGVHVFSYTFNALGFQTLTIVDTSNSSILGTAIVDVLAKSGGGGGGGGGLLMVHLPGGRRLCAAGRRPFTSRSPEGPAPIALASRKTHLTPVAAKPSAVRRQSHSGGGRKIAAPHVPADTSVDGTGRRRHDQSPQLPQVRHRLRRDINSHLVGVTPRPALPGLIRGDHGVRGRMRVSRGVPTRGVVTATHVAARQTQAQVNPRRPRRQALLAAIGRTRRDRFDLRGVFAGRGSSWSLGPVGDSVKTNCADERLRRGDQAWGDAQRSEAHCQQSRHHRLSTRQFSAQADRPSGGVRQDDPQQSQDRFMAVQVVIVDRGVIAGRCQRVLGQVVGTDRKEIHITGQCGNGQCGRRGLHHGAKGRRRLDLSLHAQGVKRLAHAAEIVFERHHRNQHLDRGSWASFRIAPICVRTSWA